MSSDVTHSVATFLEEHGIRSTRIVVGVSGGVDSMVLLHILTTLRNRLQLDLHVAHVHHGLRGVEADDDERFVAATADALGLACTTVHVETRDEADRTGSGLEAAARHLRYNALERIAIETQAPYIAVAHTADDVAETLIMHMARGSGLDGLTSHYPLRPLGQVTLVRPMQDRTRSEVEEVAHQIALRWREDATNADLRYRRNQVRQLVMPTLREVFGPDVGQRLQRTALLLRDARTIVDRSLHDLKTHAIHREEGIVRIDLHDLQDAPSAVVTELLRAGIRELLGGSASWVDTQRIRMLITAEVGGQASLANGIIAVREREHLVLRSVDHLQPVGEVVIGRDGAYVAGSERLDVRTQAREEVTIDPDPMILQLDAAAVHGTLRWRTWNDGDRFHPFGMDGSQLVSDLLTDRKVPHDARRMVRVLADDDGILWVCGLRADERTRLTASTMDVITVRLRPLP